MIQGHGPASPQGMFITDSAQSEDFKTNYALSGYSGTLLRGMCRSHGLDFDNQFWKTSLIKDVVPKATEDDETLLAAMVSNYSPLLVEEINALNPHLLIPLGELSFKFLTGISGIRKFRGSVVNPSALIGLHETRKVMPVLGPYPYLYQEYRQRVISGIDIGKISKHLNANPIPDNFFNIWVCESSSALRNFLDRSYKDDAILVFDIETFAGIPSCISFCFDGFESVCIPFLDKSIDRDNRVLMMDLVARILASPIKKVNQNIKYDWKILERWGFKVNNVIGDTMLAASTLYCEFPKNLGFLTSIYTDLPYFKDEGREFDPAKHAKTQFYLYNAKDSLATHQIYTKQIEEISEQGVGFVYGNLCQLIPIYRGMEDNGIRIDDSCRQSLLGKYESLFRIECLKLARLAGLDYINPHSPKQMSDLVFNLLGFEKIRGVKGTDEESLEQLMAWGVAKHSPIVGKDILQCIINCRKIHKVIEIIELPVYPDGRFRCEFNLAGTENGRTSAGKCTDQILYLDEKGKIKLKNLGHSLQTIGKHGFMMDGITYGKDLRSMFVPSYGYRFVEIDLSGAEARVDRVLSGNFDMEVFTNPGIHKLTASWIYNCAPSEIKKDILIDGVDRYFMGKTTRHAGERNMKADRLVMMTQRPLKECMDILTKFHTSEPAIREVFHKDIIKAVDETRVLIAPNGRRRDFFDRIDNHTYNEAISTLPQMIVSDQTKFSFIKTFEECSYARLLAEMHDGALAEVPIGNEMEYGLVYKKNVEIPIDFRFGSIKRDYQLIIPCEMSMGDSWDQLKGVDFQ